MNKIGMVNSIINCVSVLGFAVCMLCGIDFGSYLASMFIALSFVPMISAFCHEGGTDKKTAGYSAMIFDRCICSRHTFGIFRTDDGGTS